MSTFKKFAGIAMGALLATSIVASGSYAPVPALDVQAEEAGSGETQPTEEQPTENQSEEMAAYLFVHFVGQGTADEEQIYFSVSRDGAAWETLNETQPVLKSNLGTKGVRDPHIIRSPKGDKFYLIATDLSIFYLKNDWTASQKRGSKSIIIWESDDLVNWSEPRIREIARPDAGCAWAPESVWDNERKEYMVFWASKTQPDDYGMHRVYRCYTKDFDTFTEPELYIESKVSWIDTTFLEHDGVYYRFTKEEDKKYVFMEKSTSLNGEFELVSTYRINGKTAAEARGYEGPSAYKLNGENKWCLLLDDYGNGGCKLFVTDDITKGEFVSGEDFDSNGTTFRHGTVMPITLSEYNALLKKWPVDGKAETGELIFELNFDGENLTASKGNATISSSGGTLTYAEGYNGGKAVQLNGSKFISITGTNNPLKNLSSCTVSFAVQVQRSDTSWWFYAAPNTNEQQGSGYKEKYLGAFSKNGTLTCERYNNNGSRPTPATTGYTQNKWMHITLVYHTNSTMLYIDGERVQKIPSTVKIAEMLGGSPVIQLGKANWGSTGEFAEGLLDEFRIHNYAMSEDEVVANYKAVKGVS